jgi:hypothetical protein
LLLKEGKAFRTTHQLSPELQLLLLLPLLLQNQLFEQIIVY